MKECWKKTTTAFWCVPKDGSTIPEQESDTNKQPHQGYCCDGDASAGATLLFTDPKCDIN